MGSPPSDLTSARFRAVPSLYGAEQFERVEIDFVAVDQAVFQLHAANAPALDDAISDGDRRQPFIEKSIFERHARQVLPDPGGIVAEQLLQIADQRGLALNPLRNAGV